MRDADDEYGRWLDRDAVPETFEPILKRMFRELGPVLANTIARLPSAHPLPDGSLPRAIGRHAFELDGARGERASYPFNVFRWQRVNDHYKQFDDDARARADDLLARVGGAGLMRAELGGRIVRTANRLFLSPG